jgi:antitoxin StbD
MTAFCEYAQRGATGQKNISAKFTGDEIDLEKVANNMATKLKSGTSEDFEEWP